MILEVPASPVVEGDKVSLYCRKKDTQSNHIADFYKDGSKLGTWYSNNMTIQNVSKSDEGLYKCSISGAGESPQSWLTVLQVKGDEGMFNNSIEAANEEIRPSSHPPNLPSLLWIVVLVALMLLVMGLLLCRKHRGRETLSHRNYMYIFTSVNDLTDSHLLSLLFFTSSALHSVHVPVLL